MTRRELIRYQLEHGLPPDWISDELVEALEFARGGVRLKHPAPECASSDHAAALLRFAAKIEEEE